MQVSKSEPGNSEFKLPSCSRTVLCKAFRAYCLEVILLQVEHFQVNVFLFKPGDQVLEFGLPKGAVPLACEVYVRHLCSFPFS